MNSLSTIVPSDKKTDCNNWRPKNESLEVAESPQFNDFCQMTLNILQRNFIKQTPLRDTEIFCACHHDHKATLMEKWEGCEIGGLVHLQNIV